MHGRIFRAFPIGPFTIIPEGAPATTGIPVILGRKGAFGSGEHETTVACLEIRGHHTYFRLTPLTSGGSFLPCHA